MFSSSKNKECKRDILVSQQKYVGKSYAKVVVAPPSASGGVAVRDEGGNLGGRASKEDLKGNPENGSGYFCSNCWEELEVC